MKKIDLGQTAAVLANLGVIAGVLFLALELQQNNELIEAEGRLNRSKQVIETWNTLVTHPELALLLVKDRTEEQLTDAEEIVLNAFWMTSLYSMQWQFQEKLEMHQLSTFGLIVDTYGSMRRAWKGNGPGAASSGRSNFDPEFIRFMEDKFPELSRTSN
jgi:hypothetical protein